MEFPRTTQEAEAVDMEQTEATAETSEVAVAVAPSAEPEVLEEPRHPMPQVTQA